MKSKNIEVLERIIDSLNSSISMVRLDILNKE